MTRVSHDPI